MKIKQRLESFFSDIPRATRVIGISTLVISLLSAIVAVASIILK